MPGLRERKQAAAIPMPVSSVPPRPAARTLPSESRQQRALTRMIVGAGQGWRHLGRARHSLSRDRMRRERVRAEQRVHTMLRRQDAAAHFSAARPSTERSPDHRVAQQPQLEQGDARRHVLLARALRRRAVEHERLRERHRWGAEELLGPP